MRVEVRQAGLQDNADGLCFLCSARRHTTWWNLKGYGLGTERTAILLLMTIYHANKFHRQLLIRFGHSRCSSAGHCLLSKHRLFHHCEPIPGRSVVACLFTGLEARRGSASNCGRCGESGLRLQGGEVCMSIGTWNNL